MRYDEFDLEYKDAKRRIRDAGGAGVAEEQVRLRALVPELTSDEDRRVALSLIDRLPERAVTPPPSPLMAEALRIQDSAFFAGGTTEERLAVLAEARRKIFDIADRAGEEGPTIRGLTRMLERRELYLTEPAPWDDDQQARDR
jgi:hypothetical protein